MPTDRPMTLVIAAGDEATAAALAREFDDVGCTVEGAFSNAEKALRAVGELRPDAAILDARLADEAALQLTLSLRQRKIRISLLRSPTTPRETACAPKCRTISACTGRRRGLALLRTWRTDPTRDQPENAPGYGPP